MDLVAHHSREVVLHDQHHCAPVSCIEGGCVGRKSSSRLGKLWGKQVKPHAGRNIEIDTCKQQLHWLTNSYDGRLDSQRDERLVRKDPSAIGRLEQLGTKQVDELTNLQAMLVAGYIQAISYQYVSFKSIVKYMYMLSW